MPGLITLQNHQAYPGRQRKKAPPGWFQVGLDYLGCSTPRA